MRIVLSVGLALFFFALSFETEVQGAVIFTPSFSLAEQYNDNLFFSDQDKQADFATVLSPSLSMAVTSKNATLTIGYHGSAQFHSQHTEADGYFQSLSFDIDLPILNRQIRGLEVKVTEEISYSPELPGFSFGSGGTGTDIDENFNQVLLEGEGVQQPGRVDTFRNLAGISLRYFWTKHFSTSSSYTNVITRYSGDELEDTTVHSSTAGARYDYHVSSRTVWTSNYGLSVATFGEGREMIHQINTGVVHRLSALVTVTGNAGLSSVEDGFPGFDRLTQLIAVNGNTGALFVKGASPGANVAAGISKRYKRGRFNLQYDRNLVTGLGVIRGLTRRQSLIGNASHVLEERIESSVQVGYASNKSFEGNEVDVATYTAEASLIVRFFSWLDGTLSYTYLNQRSKGEQGRDGERNVVSFSLKAIGPSWRMIK